MHKNIPLHTQHTLNSVFEYTDTQLIFFTMRECDDDGQNTIAISFFFFFIRISCLLKIIFYDAARTQRHDSHISYSINTYTYQISLIYELRVCVPVFCMNMIVCFAYNHWIHAWICVHLLLLYVSDISMWSIILQVFVSSLIHVLHFNAARYFFLYSNKTRREKISLQHKFVIRLNLSIKWMRHKPD